MSGATAISFYPDQDQISTGCTEDWENFPSDIYIPSQDSSTKRPFCPVPKIAGATHSLESMSAFLSNIGVSASGWVTRFQRELADLRQLESGWDSYDSPPPGSDAIALAAEFLDMLWRIDDAFRPSRIAPSVDGGVVVSFLRDDVRANIEFFDSGEIAAAVAQPGHDVRVWEVENTDDDLAEAIRNIRDSIEN